MGSIDVACWIRKHWYCRIIRIYINCLKTETNKLQGNVAYDLVVNLETRNEFWQFSWLVQNRKFADERKLRSIERKNVQVSKYSFWVIQTNCNFISHLWVFIFFFNKLCKWCKLNLMEVLSYLCHSIIYQMPSKVEGRKYTNLRLISHISWKLLT